MVRGCTEVGSEEDGEEEEENEPLKRRRGRKGEVRLGVRNSKQIA